MLGLNFVLIITIIVVWALTALGMVAIGKFLRRGVVDEEAFFVGFAAVIPLLIVAHFVMPISTILLFALWVVGVNWLRLNWRKLKFSFGLLALVVLTAIFASRYATGADDGLYHLQTVIWNAQYAVIPGLANVQTRFGFNSTYYLFAALFHGLPGGATHYAAGILWLGTFLFLLRSRYGKILLIGLCLWFGYVSTLSNDFVIVCLTLFIGYKFFEAFDNTETDLLSFLLVVVVGTTIKLSFAVFGFTALVLILLHKRTDLRPYILTAVASAGIFLVWMAHGVVLSGYPLYPLTIGAFNVDWRLPIAEANTEYAWIWSWARIPHVRPENIPSDWIVEWFQNKLTNEDMVLPITLGLCLSPIALRHQLKWILFLPIVVGLLYWFLTAPDPRFAAGLLWLAAANVLYYAIPHNLDRKAGYVLVVLCCFMGTFYIQPIQVVNENYTEIAIPTGTIYIVNPGDDQCFDFPLPCSPSSLYVGRFEYRESGELRYGFRPTQIAQ